MSSDQVVADIRELSDRSERRKRQVRQALAARLVFEGTRERTYTGIIDAYHGETGLPMDAAAVAALDRAWGELLHTEPPLDYADGRLYDKRQPLALRELAAHRLFGRLDGVRSDEVVVCPYSSTVLLEEAVATLARPGGVIVCPEGFYKSAAIHIQKSGLRIVTCAATADDRFAIDPRALAECL
ncbi:hypothetical protein ACW9HQ_48570, partial [Nocardia gipuzkoensis]